MRETLGEFKEAKRVYFSWKENHLQREFDWEGWVEVKGLKTAAMFSSL